MDPMLSTLEQLLGVPDEMEQHFNAPTRTYIRVTKAMASVETLANVEVEGENVLTISRERKREDDQEAKYIRMERRLGKFIRKFTLPGDSNMDAISASCHDGVLSVTVPKQPPTEPKKPKTIEVKIA